MGTTMTREQTLDLYFIDARSKLIDIAGFLDRTERAPGGEDLRLTAFREALAVLNSNQPHKARSLLMLFSDPTTEPVASPQNKPACGTWLRN
jgi:hypothetical protein